VQCVQRALSNPLVEANLRDAQGALINVIGGMDMTLAQAQLAIEEVKRSLSEDRPNSWATQTCKACPDRTGNQSGAHQQ
jgi:cell division protein FtsZ